MVNGQVLIIGARDTNIHEKWRDNPQVNWISSEEAERKEISSNTRAVLFTRFVSHPVQNQILQQCRNKHITFVPELLGTGEINSKLELFLGDKKEKLEKLPYGFIRDYISTNVDLTKETKIEVERILPILKAKGAKTTEISLANEINKLKRSRRITGVPDSVKSKNQILLETLDDAIEGLKLVRETVSTLESENIELKTKLSKLQEVLK